MSPAGALSLCAVVCAVVYAIDRVARRTGLYEATHHAWPEGWRAIPLGAPRRDAPYRVGGPVQWERVVPAGVPRATSLGVVAATGIGLLWTLATVLALSDIDEVMSGARSGGTALASFLLCATRAGLAFAATTAAFERRTARFVACCAAALGLDLALATTPIPCSDVRADDIRMALAGITVDLALAVGFALSAWRRRGLVTREATRVAPLN